MLLDGWLQVPLLLLLLLAVRAKRGTLKPFSPGRFGSPCIKVRCKLRTAGQPCGVYTPSCAQGLFCIPRPGERLPVRAMIQGRGVYTPPRAEKKEGGWNQTGAGGSWRISHRVGHSAPEPLPLQSQTPLQDVSISKTQLQQLSLSTDAKEEFDMAPCRMHLTAILQELKAPLYLNREDIFIPNCDTKGFYRRKQCRASKGQKRGQCWCVDKRGHPLEEQEEIPFCLLANSD